MEILQVLGVEQKIDGKRVEWRRRCEKGEDTIFFSEEWG
jgi:hypothetical protein